VEADAVKGLWLLVGAAALVVAAVVADRLLLAAIQHEGTYAAQPWTRELALAADRIPKLVVLAALGVMLVGVVSTRPPAPVAWILVAAGAFVAVALPLSLAAEFEPLLPLAFEVLPLAEFALWAGTGLLLVGVVGPWLGPTSAAARRDGVGTRWVRIGVALGLAVVVAIVDGAISSAYIDASSRAGPMAAFVAWEGVGRLLVLAGLAATLRLATGDRDPLVGVIYVIGGLVVFVGLALAAQLAPPPSAGLPTDGGLPVAGYALRWLTGGFVLLGTWELIRPAAQSVVGPEDGLQASDDAAIPALPNHS
jgi:hypothetical protein